MYTDYNYVSEYNKGPNIKKYLKSVFFAILGFIFLWLIVSIIDNSTFFSNNEYKDYEKLMVEYAKDYVNKNNIVVNDEMYIELSKLNIGVKEKCRLYSGVFVNINNEYTPYLICDSYESKIIDNNSKYTLRGNSVLLISSDIPYIEQGIVENQKYNVNGTVGKDVGVYNLKYTVMKYEQIDDVLNRKVVVLNNKNLKKIMPEITLNGEMIEYIKINQQYVDKGVKVFDSIDGDLKNKVIIQGDINSNRDGEYLLTYLITNSRGYANSVSRKVVVVKNLHETAMNYIVSPNTLTNSDVTIYLDIISDDFDYVLLPDGSRSGKKNISYKVDKNGDYKFVCYEKSGKSYSKTVNINNINKSIPTGSCTATIYNDRTEVFVSVNSDLQISKYTYLFDNVKFENIKTNSYSVRIKSPKNVRVIAKNNVGTEKEIICKIIDKSYRKIYVDSNNKNCLEGYTCHNQNSYCSNEVQFCSTDSCGPICQTGCSVTSMSTIISRYGLKSSNGEIYNPLTLTTEVYDKVCSSYCSGDNVAKKVAKFLGLSASKTYRGIGENKNKLIEFLKNDTPVLIRVGEGPYTESGHLMAILGINNEGKVFLANTNKRGTTASFNPKYSWNTWVSIDEIASGAGHSNWFLAIGPAGMYNENS